MPESTNDRDHFFQRLQLSQEELFGLVCRAELWTQLLRRHEEESIVEIVALPEAWIQQQYETLVPQQGWADWCNERAWSDRDLRIHLQRSEALKRYARQNLSAGLEDAFLSSKGAYDQVVYSLIRVRDSNLAQELWIRLEEGETTFAELASNFSQGPEAARNGIIGPIEFSQLQPAQFQQALRTLRPGQIQPPFRVGEWTVLLRLEQISLARFDAEMRVSLLNQRLDGFLQNRVQMRLAGQVPPPLVYDGNLDHMI